MTRYQIADRARADLVSIADYLKGEAGLAVAKKVQRSLFDAFRMLAAMPGMGHAREDLTALPVKFWQSGSYFIVYTPDATPIEIVRVLHTSRDVSRIIAGNNP